MKLSACTLCGWQLWCRRSVMSNSLHPTDCSPQGSSVHGILWARILEWVAISFSRESSPPRDQTRICCIEGRFFTMEPPEKPCHLWDLYKIIIPQPIAGKIWRESFLTVILSTVLLVSGLVVLNTRVLFLSRTKR